MPKEQLHALFRNVLFGKSIEELRDLEKDFHKKGKGDMPAGLAAFISGVTRDIAEGELGVVNSMLDRMYGKATSRVETITGTDGATDAEKTEFLLFRLNKKLHAKQRDIFIDNQRQKMICMPRRWGKSFLVFSEMVAACLSEPHSRCLYVGRSIKEAEKQFGEMRLDWLYKMGLPADTDLKTIFPEGSWIDTYGLGPGADGNAIRGRKYKKVVYDEFFHLREDYLEYFIEQVIAPMQRDYADWQEIRCGTIPETPFTFGQEEWEKAVRGETNWQVYTTNDPDENPNITEFEPWFKEKYPNRPVTEPWVQREFFCRWVFDTETQMFPEWHTYDAKKALPNDKISHILFGGDFGFNDPSAVVGIAWNEREKSGYVFFEEEFNFLTVPKGINVQEHLDQVCCRAWEKAIDLVGVKNLGKIYWRFDSANPADIQRLKKNVTAKQVTDARTKIKITGAYKLQSEFMYERMKTLFRSGAIVIPADGPLEKEFKQTVYVRDEATGLVTNEINDKFHPNLIPAMRYALEWDLLAEIGINVHNLKGGR